MFTMYLLIGVLVALVDIASGLVRDPRLLKQNISNSEFWVTVFVLTIAWPIVIINALIDQL